MDFEIVDIEMITNKAKEEERRATEGVTFVLTDIEAKVEAEIAATNVIVTGRGEATDEGADGQTVIAFTDLPSEQA